MGPESCSLMPTLRRILVLGCEDGYSQGAASHLVSAARAGGGNLLGRRTIVLWRSEQQTAS
jgi:hypothetical protein